MLAAIFAFIKFLAGLFSEYQSEASKADGIKAADASALERQVDDMAKAKAASDAVDADVAAGRVRVDDGWARKPGS